MDLDDLRDVELPSGQPFTETTWYRRLRLALPFLAVLHAIPVLVILYTLCMSSHFELDVSLMIHLALYSQIIRSFHADMSRPKEVDEELQSLQRIILTEYAAEGRNLDVMRQVQMMVMANPQRAMITNVSR